jgi:proline dehydrogenase
MSFLDRAALASLPLIPRPVMRRLALRYIAGEDLESALAKLTELRERGFRGIIDLLGEDVVDEGDARAVVERYREAADRVAAEGLDAYVSVKPTHVGLRISEELAAELYGELVAHCEKLGIFVRVEMEDHTTTDGTLRVFEQLRAKSQRVGIVLQARLLRTPADIASLRPGPLAVRMVKGVYLEPRAIAHVEAQAIRDAYVECSRLLLARGARVSFATHDEALANRVFELTARARLGREDYEFQVLLGVRESLWEAWRAAGHVVRVYVPYGPEWRPYSTRRLRKNPEIFRHVLRDLVHRNSRR